jgi:hypothetical protein
MLFFGVASYQGRLWPARKGQRENGLNRLRKSRLKFETVPSAAKAALVYQQLWTA